MLSKTILIVSTKFKGQHICVLALHLRWTVQNHRANRVQILAGFVSTVCLSNLQQANLVPETNDEQSIDTDNANNHY